MSTYQSSVERELPYAYACPEKCGCIWRDNNDGSMSLFGKNSKSCEVCEFLPLDKLIPLYRAAAPAETSLPPITKARKCHKEIHVGAILVYCDLPREHEGECRIPSITNAPQVPEPYSCENSSDWPINVPQMFVPPAEDEKRRAPINAIYESATGEGFDFQYKPAAEPPSTQRVSEEPRDWRGVRWIDSIRASGLAEEIAKHFGHECDNCGEDVDTDSCEFAWVESKISDFLYSVGTRVPAPSAEREAEPMDELDQLAAELHWVYQAEAKRQGDVRHPERYADLPENIKQYDRVLAKFILERQSQRDPELVRKGVKAGLEEAARIVAKWNFMACSDADGLQADIRAIPAEAIAARIGAQSGHEQGPK